MFRSQKGIFGNFTISSAFFIKLAAFCQFYRFRFLKESNCLVSKALFSYVFSNHYFFFAFYSKFDLILFINYPLRPLCKHSLTLPTRRHRILNFPFCPVGPCHDKLIKTKSEQQKSIATTDSNILFYYIWASDYYITVFCGLFCPIRSHRICSYILMKNREESLASTLYLSCRSCMLY